MIHIITHLGIAHIGHVLTMVGVLVGVDFMAAGITLGMIHGTEVTMVGTEVTMVAGAAVIMVLVLIIVMMVDVVVQPIMAEVVMAEALIEVVVEAVVWLVQEEVAVHVQKQHQDGVLLCEVLQMGAHQATDQVILE